MSNENNIYYCDHCRDKFLLFISINSIISKSSYSLNYFSYHIHYNIISVTIKSKYKYTQEIIFVLRNYIIITIILLIL